MQAPMKCSIRISAMFGAAVALVGAGFSTPAWGAGLLIADGGLGGVLEIKEHTAHVTINNGVAVTQVTQVFHNTENRQVEALYTFPVPGEASVANFSMWINGKEMVGEVVEKKRAREIYNSYKQVRRDPGLLEQTDYKTFEMRIFPIAANADQRVEITYYQELNYDHDRATYVYPLATQTRSGINARTKGKFGLTMETKSEVPIVEMASPSHADDFIITRHNENYYQASLETPAGDLNRDVVLSYKASRPQTGVDLITFREAGEDGYFCMSITAGKELEEKRSGADYVFVLDVSGSMSTDGKLALSQNSVAAFLGVLADDDQFEVMTFNVQPTTLFGNLAKTTPECLKQANEFLMSQRARGGTSLKPALATAFRYANADRPLNVVILSDGMAEQQERAALLAAAAAKPGNARIFCIGVGNEVNRPLLEQLAEDAGGLAAFISQGDDFNRQADAFRRKLMHPVASNLRIDFADAGVYDVEPKQLPNLYFGMPVRLYGRYRSDKPAKATIRMNIDGAEVKNEMEVNLPKTDAANPEIERMWAWHRVQSLLKEADRNDARPQVADEIVRLGEGYSIVTEYTSFIVLENDAEYKLWKIDRRNAVRTTRDRKAHQELAAKLEVMRDQATLALGPEPAATAKAVDQASPATTAQPLPQWANRTPDMFGGPTPTGSPTPSPIAQAPQTPSPTVRDSSSETSHSSRGFNLNTGSGRRGGGAIDPISAVLCAGIAAVAFATRRFNKSR